MFDLNKYCPHFSLPISLSQHIFKKITKLFTAYYLEQMSADYVVPDRYDRYLKDTTRELQTGTWTSNPYSRRRMMNGGTSPTASSPSPTRVSPFKSVAPKSPLTDNSRMGALPPLPVSPRTLQTTNPIQTEMGANPNTMSSLSPPSPSYINKQPKLCYSRLLPHDINDVNFLIEKSATPHFMQPSSARIHSSSPPSGRSPRSARGASTTTATSDDVAVVSRQVLTDKEELQLELPSITSTSPNKSRGGAVPTATFTSKLDKFNAQVYTGGLNCRLAHSSDDDNITTTM